MIHGGSKKLVISKSVKSLFTSICIRRNCLPGLPITNTCFLEAAIWTTESASYAETRSGFFCHCYWEIRNKRAILVDYIDREYVE